MGISSLAFYGMAFRVPAVSLYLTNTQDELELTPFTEQEIVPHSDCFHHYLCLPLILRHGHW